MKQKRRVRWKPEEHIQQGVRNDRKEECAEPQKSSWDVALKGHL